MRRLWNWFAAATPQPIARKIPGTSILCFESWDTTEQSHPAEPDRKEKDESVGRDVEVQAKEETDDRQRNGYRSNDHPREPK